MKLKTVKRIAALGLASVMTMGLFAGCGNKNQGNQASENKVSEEAKTEESKQESTDGNTKADEEPVVIQWLAYNTYAQPDPESEVVKAVEEKFNVKFEFWFIDDQKWDEMLGARLSSGEMPDVLKIKNTANIPTYVKQGILAEVTDEMKAKMPTYMKYFEEADADGTALLDAYYEGKQYIWKPLSSKQYPTVLVWRTDWLKAVGIDSMPSTIEEMEEALYAFKNNDPDGDGANDTYGMSNTVMNAVFGAYGAIPLKEYRGTGTQNLFYTMKDGKVAFACVQPEMKEALATLQKWYKDGVIDPEFVTGENTAGYWATSQAFENGKVGVTGMANANHWNPPLTEDATKGGQCYEGFIALNPDTVWGETIDIGPAIVGPDGASGTHCWSTFGTSGFAITTQCAADQRKVDAICAMMEARASDKEYATLALYGIEGKHHKIDEKTGNPVRIEPYTKNTEYIAEGLGVFSDICNYNFWDNPNSEINQFRAKYATPGYQDLLVPATEAANQYLTDLKTFALDAYIKIITGEESVDYFDTFVEEFNQLGGKQIIDEINAAIG